MGRLVTWLIASGLPERRARQLAIGLLVLCLIVALFIGKLLYDRALIARHQASDVAIQAQADRAADTAAATQRRTDDARLSAEADALERITENAADPLAARRAYHLCVRLQQQARASGRLTPACR